MKTKILISVILFLGGVILILFILRFFLGGDEDSWLCQNCQWVKHGQPSAPKPNQPCCLEEKEVIVFSPQPNQVIESPLMVEGEAKGYWFFEASFPIRILDEQGKGGWYCPSAERLDDD